MADLLDFDFGFTAVDENELEAVQKVTTEASSTSASLQETEEKLNKLYNAILPLLTNLKKNPEKEYILWPNRVEKIEQFEDESAKKILGNACLLKGVRLNHDLPMRNQLGRGMGFGEQLWPLQPILPVVP